MRRRLSLDGGIEREQNLLHLGVGGALDQTPDVEALRPDPIERRQVTAEDMIDGVRDPGPLERPQVADLLDHDDQRAIAARILTDGTRAQRIDAAARRALG